MGSHLDTVLPMEFTNSKFRVHKLQISSLQTRNLSFRKEFLVFRVAWLPSNYHLNNMAAIVDDDSVVANSGVDEVSF